MVVIPASYSLDIEVLKKVFHASRLELARERDFNEHFSGCEPGALPPFGNLYGMELYLADILGRHELITFCAGSHSELIQMHYRDYQRLAGPALISTGFEHQGMTPPRMREHRGMRLSG
ncbi:MAG: YbaK/EbsC family protein [Marinobacterium sp.]|nr:YbaK/EbsC family protein [Marinobacterium sp.]